MHKTKPRILFLLRLPPRLTGATLMNSFVQESELLHSKFRIKTIALPHAKTHAVVGSVSLGKLWEVFWALVKLFFTLLFRRYRFVYFQMSPLGGAFIRDVLFVAVIKLTRTRIVHHMHGKGIAQEKERKFFSTLYRFVFRNQEVICLAESLTQDIREVFNGKPYIVPNVIKLDLENEVTRTLPKKLNIMYLSNLFISKGVLVFIEALSLLKQRGIPFSARIIGNEAELSKADLALAFKKNKLLSSDIQYVGPKYGQEKWDEYKGSDVLVFPSLNDIWGLVILEAMQASLPVIASHDGAIPEIVRDHKTGFVVEKNKPEIICDKLEFLFKNPKRSQEMGRNGRKLFLANYSYQKFEEKMLETFHSILS